MARLPSSDRARRRLTTTIIRPRRRYPGSPRVTTPGAIIGKIRTVLDRVVRERAFRPPSRKPAGNCRAPVVNQRAAAIMTLAYVRFFVRTTNTSRHPRRSTYWPIPSKRIVGRDSEPPAASVRPAGRSNLSSIFRPISGESIRREHRTTRANIFVSSNVSALRRSSFRIHLSALVVSRPRFHFIPPAVT